MLGKLGHQLEDLINARGRSSAHVLEGVALAAGAVLLAAAVTARRRGAPRAPARLIGGVWPSVGLALGVSGLRVWNAPSGPERDRALTLWGALQLASAIAALINPRRRTAQLLAAAGALGAGAGYAAAARKVDPASGALVSPYLGWSSLTSAVASRLRHEPAPTIH
jgi:tryptophan-rich sensory protein